MYLVFDELADRQLTALEEGGTSARLTATCRTLGRIEVDPHDPSLGTRTFVTQGFGHVRVTPTGHEDEVVLWTWRSDGEILVIAISPFAP
jgi:hypothetical protein